MSCKSSTPENPPVVRLADYRPPPWLVDRVELDLNIHEDGVLVEAELEVRRNPEAAGREDLCLNGQGLELQAVEIDGAPAQYRLSEQKDALHIKAPADGFRLLTRSRFDPKNNTDLMGLYRSQDIYCTQCEPEGFRRITWYPDRPDVLAGFRVRIEADKRTCPVLLSNGNPVARGELSGGRHWVVWDDPHPKPCYLFALVAGRLECLEDSFITASGRRVALHLWASPGRMERLEFALKALKAAMRWDEEHYGREYDLDLFQIAAVDHFNFGAMENKGLNIFNAAALYAVPELTTDAGYRTVRAIIAHEYFHNWSGNRVTLRDWFQLCLKEGFTVFRDQQFSCDFEGAAQERIRQISLLRQRQFPEDAGPLAHPVRPDNYRQIDNFYTVTVYEKGAEVVRMLRELLGEKAFRSACELYFERCDGTAARVEDFVACMEEVGDRDLGTFMRWYQMRGTPSLQLADSWDSNRGEYRLTLKQNTPVDDSLPRHIPVRTALLKKNGEQMHCSLESGEVRNEWMLELSVPECSWTFTGLEERPVPSVLRGFSAPVRLNHGFDGDGLKALASQRADVVGRWEALQSIYLKVLQHRLEAPDSDWGSEAAVLWREIIGDVSLADGERAALLTLPPVASAYGFQPAKPIEFAAVRRQLEVHLALECRQSLTHLWQRCCIERPYSPAPKDMGQRACASLALYHLTLAEQHSGSGDEWQQRCLDALEADNLTDQLGGLQALLQSGSEVAPEALRTLEKRWSDEPLLMHQWLAAQAAMSSPDTLERIEKLTEHRAFSPESPNSVRALLGRFSANDALFHSTDGRAYAFVADWILRLDAINPITASHLATAFSTCSLLDAPQQHRAGKVLEELKATPGLSDNLKEQLLRMLQPAKSIGTP